MTDAEAVKYLLEVVEIDLAASRELYARIKDAVPNADRRGTQYLDILWTARPRVLTYDFIARKIEHLSGSYPYRLAINGGIKRLRRALEQTDYPIDIINHNGMGYSLTAPEDWHAPWEQET